MFDEGIPPTVLFLAYPGSSSDCDRDLKSSLNIKSQAEVSCGVPWGGATGQGLPTAFLWQQTAFWATGPHPFLEPHQKHRGQSCHLPSANLDNLI